MKQFMIDMMSMMMPYMKPIALVGAGLAIAALILGGTSRMSGSRSNLSVRLGWLATAVGLFFVACEAAGRLLGMEPTLLFASDSFDRAMYYNQWPFWTIGLALSAAGYVAASVARNAKIRA